MIVTVIIHSSLRSIIITWVTFWDQENDLVLSAQIRSGRTRKNVRKILEARQNKME